MQAARRQAMASATDRDPRRHTQKMQKALQDIRNHLREDIQKVDEPQLKAMFETSAEVLGGLEKAFKDYEQKNEKAWSGPSHPTGRAMPDKEPIMEVRNR